MSPFWFRAVAVLFLIMSLTLLYSEMIFFHFPEYSFWALVIHVVCPATLTHFYSSSGLLPSLLRLRFFPRLILSSVETITSYSKECAWACWLTLGYVVTPPCFSLSSFLLFSSCLTSKRTKILFYSLLVSCDQSRKWEAEVEAGKRGGRKVGGGKREVGGEKRKVGSKIGERGGRSGCEELALSEQRICPVWWRL
jgi:hypothetical protein